MGDIVTSLAILNEVKIASSVISGLTVNPEGFDTSLIFLLAAVAVFGYFAVKRGMFKGNSEEKTSENENAMASMPQTSSLPQNAPAMSDSELVAVIAAAIAASLNTQADKLIVRSFRKVPNWTETAKRESMEK